MEINKSLKYFVIYIFTLVTSAFIFVTFFDLKLKANGTLSWDAAHYFHIMTYGYEGFRVAFFPLFPMIWKILNVNSVSISLINYFIFLSSFLFLKKILHLNWEVFFIYLSVPSLIFFALPYSESIFFLSLIPTIYGLKNQNSKYVAIGILFASMARPSISVLIIAILITEILFRKNWKSTFLNFSFYLISFLSGQFLVALIQWFNTGKWFEFYKVQSLWGNKLQIPNLPLSSWSGDMIVRFDAIALFFSGLALIAIFQHFKGNKISKIEMFGMLNIVGLASIILLFRGGSLFSLNRFLFCSPFFIILINFYYKRVFFTSIKSILLLGLFSFLIWNLLFFSFVHILTTLLFLSLSVIIVSFLLLNEKVNINLQKFSFYFLFIFNTVVQTYFYLLFLNNNWIG